jgi:hypothetical protein
VSERRAVRDDERDLPGLLDWGDELLEATLRAERVGDARGAGGRWRTRRRAILVLAVTSAALVVPGAVVATHSIWDDPVGPTDPAAPVPSTPAVRLVDGRSGDVAWRIGGWNAGGGLVCLRTEAWRGSERAMEASNCDTPKTDAKLTVSLAAAGGLTLIVGTAAPAVQAVGVRPPAGDAVRVATLAVAAERLRRSGLNDAARVYVAVIPRRFTDSARAPAVTAFGAGGEQLGAIGPAAR